MAFDSLIRVMKTPTSRVTPRFAAVLSAVMPLLLAACATQAADRSPGRRLILFLDQSASIDRGQRRQWQNDAGGLVRGVGDGWSISIYGIHDHTLEAAALFEVHVPCSPRMGLTKPRRREMPRFNVCGRRLWPRWRRRSTLGEFDCIGCATWARPA